jgi:hypothetical protein
VTRDGKVLGGDRRVDPVVFSGFYHLSKQEIVVNGDRIDVQAACGTLGVRKLIFQGTLLHRLACSPLVTGRAHAGAKNFEMWHVLLADNRRAKDGGSVDF